MFATDAKEMISAKRTLTEKEQKMAIHYLMIIENELDAIYKFLNKRYKAKQGERQK